MLSQKYQPNTQKGLFHRDVVNNIRKWIKAIEDSHENGGMLKKLLLLYGPIGCGKTATISVLLKGFQVYNIDPSDVRSSDKIMELAAGVTDYGAYTLANIDKWNHKNFRDKPNIVLIDNIELCERNIADMVDCIHNTSNINVPIVMICNNPKYKDTFINNSQCTYIEFNKPSLLDLNKLVMDINSAEKLSLSKDNMRKIIDSSQHDVRQLFYILEQWKLTALSKQADFDEFISTLAIKHADIDLTNKMLHLFDSSQSYDINYSFDIAASEPITISHSFFQNYVDVCNLCDHADSVKILECIADISECMSNANVTSSRIFEDQYWELYNSFTIEGCVRPSYHIKNIAQGATTNRDLYNIISPFRDISFNYINSYQEVKKISTSNLMSSLVNPHGSNIMTIHDVQSCFSLTQILINNITKVSDYFERNKKGKNTSNSEKYSLCNNIGDNEVQNVLDHLVQLVFQYKLFDLDYSRIYINKSNFDTDMKIWEVIQQVDLRVLKRLLNIFTFEKECKHLKSHVEAALKFRLLKLVLSDIAQISIEKKVTRDIKDIEEDLCNIWNFSW